MSTGGQYIYKEFEDFERAINRVLSNMEKSGTPLTFACFYTGLGLSKGTFYEYRRRGEEWQELHTQLKEIIENNINVKGLKGEINVKTAIWNLKTNYGWREATRPEAITAPTILTVVKSPPKSGSVIDLQFSRLDTSYLVQ